MHCSPILAIGLGALTVAYGIDTVVDTTTVTVISCGPEVTKCLGNSQSATISEVTETSTYCPSSISTTVTANVQSSNPTVIVPSSTNTYPTTYPVTNSSSTVSSAGEVSTPTPSSDLSSTAPPESYATGYPTAPGGAPNDYNGTMTAPTLPISETGILTASGSPTPSILTSVIIAPPTTTGSGSGSPSSTTPAKATNTNAADHLVAPGVILGLLALGACVLG